MCAVLFPSFLAGERGGDGDGAEWLEVGVRTASIWVRRMCGEGVDLNLLPLQLSTLEVVVGAQNWSPGPPNSDRSLHSWVLACASSFPIC